MKLADIRALANMAGVTQADLLALAAANDPFAVDQPARTRAGHWFGDLFDQFGFSGEVHIRRIHYRIVSQTVPVLKPDGKPYENTEGCWKYLVNASRDARYLGLVPAAAFVDRRNPDPITHFALSESTYVRVSNEGLRFAEPDDRFPSLPELEFSTPTVAAPILVEIWCEKTTANDILEPLARRHGANLITGAGEMSETAVRLFMARAAAAERPARLLYVSDFDPAGRSMPVAVARKIEVALARSGAELDIALEPIVLTPEQCVKFNLPRTPIKETEVRGAKFEARFGAGATELDALEALHPGELERIVGAALARYIDPDHQLAVNRAALEYRHSLRRATGQVHAEYEDDIEGLREEYSELIQLFGKFRKRADAVFDRIYEDLRVSDIDDFVIPPHRPADEFPAPLFDSKRDYLSQIDAYRRWQGKGDCDREAS